MTFALTPSDGNEKNVAAVTRRHFSVVDAALFSEGTISSMVSAEDEISPHNFKHLCKGAGRKVALKPVGHFERRSHLAPAARSFVSMKSECSYFQYLVIRGSPL